MSSSEDDARLEEDQRNVDEAAKLARRLEVAQRFDDAEARAKTVEMFTGGPMLGAHRYLVTGDGDDEWIASSYTVPVGFDGGEI